MNNREIDALVAEKCLGWTPIMETVRVPIPGHVDMVPGGPYLLKQQKLFLRPDGVKTVPLPCSTDVSAALDALSRACPWPQFSTAMRQTETGHWRVDISLHGGDGPDVQGNADILAEAICLAILAAHGVEVSDAQA